MAVFRCAWHLLSIVMLFLVHGITCHWIIFAALTEHLLPTPIAQQTDVAKTLFASMKREVIEVKCGNIALTAPKFSNADMSLFISYLCDYSAEL